MGAASLALFASGAFAAGAKRLEPERGNVWFKDESNNNQFATGRLPPSP